MNTNTLHTYIAKTADDLLIAGHRNSEWTGLGPVLEEDIAFSSIAQDQVGQAYHLYELLHEHLSAPEPDTFAFTRNENAMFCCHLVELPIGEYDFSLVRNWLFNHAQLIRFEMLAQCNFEPLAKLARKYKGEIKYHIFHGNTWIKQLAQGTEVSKARIQSTINEVYPIALSMFEPISDQVALAAFGIASEENLMHKWLETIEAFLQENGLKLPHSIDSSPYLGGRKGYHTTYLEPLLSEMGAVFRLDPHAAW